MDVVAQIVPTEDQIQSTLHLDPFHADCDWRVGADTFLFQSELIGHDVDVGHSRNLRNHITQRRLFFVQRDHLRQALLDADVVLIASPIVGAILPVAAFRDVVEVLAEVNRILVVDLHDHGLLDIVELIHERLFLVVLQLLVVGDAATELGLPEQRFRRRIFRVHFLGLLGHDLRFGEPLLLEEFVELLDQLGVFLFDADVRFHGRGQRSLDLFIAFLQFEVRLLTHDLGLER